MCVTKQYKFDITVYFETGKITACHGRGVVPVYHPTHNTKDKCIAGERRQNRDECVVPIFHTAVTGSLTTLCLPHTQRLSKDNLQRLLQEDFLCLSYLPAYSIEAVKQMAQN